MQEVVLKNGFRAYIEENHFSPVIAAQLWVRFGSAYEKRIEAGIAHAIEHLVFKRTNKRKIGEVAKEIESLGGVFDYFPYQIEGKEPFFLAQRL